MPIALDPKATFEYVLTDDRALPEDQRTVFVLRGLTVGEEARVADAMIASIPGQEELAFRSGTHQLTVLRYGLRGWRNFKYADGTDVEWEDLNEGRDAEDRNRILDRNLNKIPPEIRSEIAEQIRGESTLGEDE